MASYLTARERGGLTLDVRGPMGSAWMCSSAKSESCGVANVGTNAGSDRPDGPFTRALILGRLDGYDGTYSVERLTASRPAFAK